jgi:hypothetical protein
MRRPIIIPADEHMALPKTEPYRQHWEISLPSVALLSVRACSLSVKRLNWPNTIRKQTTGKPLV